MAILVAEFACAEEDYNLKAMLLSTTLLMSGLTTLAQVTIYFPTMYIYCVYTVMSCM
jgi:xanthine/uracil permease